MSESISEPDSDKRLDWRHKAVCRNEDPELFFPIGNSGVYLNQIEQAKAVCRKCTVTSACLEFALSDEHMAGIWAGKTELERRAMIAQRKREEKRTR